MHVTLQSALVLGLLMSVFIPRPGHGCSPKRSETQASPVRAPAWRILKNMDYTVIQNAKISVFIRKLLLTILENYGTINIDIPSANELRTKVQAISSSQAVENVSVKIIRANGQEYALLEGLFNLTVPRSVLESTRA